MVAIMVIDRIVMTIVVVVFSMMVGDVDYHNDTMNDDTNSSWFTIKLV